MNFFRIALLAVFFSPVFLFGQSIKGDWLMEGQTEEGETIFSKLSYMEDGALIVDFGNDGTVEIRSTYVLEDNLIHITDKDENSPCNDMTGIYEVVIVDSEMQLQLVEDPCELRRGDGSPMVMRRM